MPFWPLIEGQVSSYVFNQATSGRELESAAWGQDVFEFELAELQETKFNVLNQVIGSYSEVIANNFDLVAGTYDLHIYNDMNAASFYKYILPKGVNWSIDKINRQYGTEIEHTNIHYPKWERPYNGPFPILNSGGNIRQEFIFNLPIPGYRY